MRAVLLALVWVPLTLVVGVVAYIGHCLRGTPAARDLPAPLAVLLICWGVATREAKDAVAQFRQR